MQTIEFTLYGKIILNTYCNAGIKGLVHPKLKKKITNFLLMILLMHTLVTFSNLHNRSGDAYEK